MSKISLYQTKSQPYEKLVNAYWYWIGQEILNESECLANNSDKQFLTKEMADKIVAELKE